MSNNDGEAPPPAGSGEEAVPGQPGGGAPAAAPVPASLLAPGGPLSAAAALGEAGLPLGIFAGHPLGLGLGRHNYIS